MWKLNFQWLNNAHTSNLFRKPCSSFANIETWEIHIWSSQIIPTKPALQEFYQWGWHIDEIYFFTAMTASDHIIWNPSFQTRMPLSVWYFVTKQQKTPSGRSKLLPQITYCKTTQTISLTDITLILLPDQKNTYELCKLGLSHASWKIHEKVDRSQQRWHFTRA